MIMTICILNTRGSSMSREWYFRGGEVEPVENKAALRDEINQLTAEFLAKGGQIKGEAREALLTLEQVISMTGIRRSNILSLIKKEQFPAPIRRDQGEGFESSCIFFSAKQVRDYLVYVSGGKKP